MMLVSMVDIFWLILVAVATVSLHLYFLEDFSTTDIPSTRDVETITSKGAQRNNDTDPEHLYAISESSSLLHADLGAASGDENYSMCNVALQHAQSFFGYIRLLQYPFEFFVCTCMIALLTHCIPNLLHIWPASKALLLSHAPHWLRPSTYATVTVLGLVALSWTFRGIKSCFSLRSRKEENETFQSL
jgi:hypothetical protein